MHWATNTVIIAALVSAGLAFPCFQDFISGDSFTIPSTSKDSHILMWGSDAVHCVQVSLIGTTMVAF